MAIGVLSMFSIHHKTFQTMLVIVIFLLSCRMADLKPRGVLCELDGKQYQEGDIWHPQIQPVEKYCVNCTCLTGGEVKCSSAECSKPDCEDPKYVSGECCPVCSYKSDISKTTESDEDLSETNQLPGCHHGGEYYEHGQHFTSNKTSYEHKSNQCVICQCISGKNLCAINTCPQLPGCIKFIKVEDNCCSQCDEYEENSNPNIEENQKKQLAPGDCNSTMGPQKNGTSWKPVIVNYGEMECVVCKCSNGKVECKRVKCPEESKLKCKRPQHRRGKCCKECISKKTKKRKKEKKDKGHVTETNDNKNVDNGVNLRNSNAGNRKKKKKKEEIGVANEVAPGKSERDGLGEEKIKKNNRKNKDENEKKNEKSKKKRKGCKRKKDSRKRKKRGKKKRKRCKKNKKANKKKMMNLEDMVFHTNDTMDLVKDKLCVAKQQDYLVYVVKGENHYSLILDSVKDDQMEKTDWFLRKGRIMNTKTREVTDTFTLRRLININQLIGTSTKRNIKKFVRKLEKKSQKCKKKCKRKILDKTLKKLKTKILNLSKKC